MSEVRKNCGAGSPSAAAILAAEVVATAWRRAFALCAIAVATLAFTAPPLASPVVDHAQLLTPSTRGRLDSSLQRLWQQGGSQIAVLTMPSLDGLTIEEVSIQTVDQWKLGSASKDNGILFLVAKDERSVRIEVGQGHEGDLPDAYARRIIDEVVTPHFRGGDFDAGVVSGVQAILQRTDPGFTLDFAPQAASPRELSGTRRFPPVVVLLAGFLALMFLRGLLGGGRRRRGGLGSLATGALIGGLFGGRGGGGGFGGGFGGGGGGFSGGGASGKW